MTGEVVEQGRGAKILVFHYKRKKQYKKLRGHRQGYTAVRITEIAYDGQKFSAPDLPKKEAKPKKVKPVEVEHAPKVEAKAAKTSGKESSSQESSAQEVGAEKEKVRRHLAGNPADILPARLTGLQQNLKPETGN